MSYFVEWIAAVADEGNAANEAARQNNEQQADRQPVRKAAESNVPLRAFPAHNFPPLMVPDEAVEDDPLDRNPDLWLYRNRTVSLLRRYLRISLETGRLPSIVGREFIRAKMTSYTAATFEDRVIFVRDVEMCLNRLGKWDQQLIARVILQEHNQWDAARMLNCGRATIQRRLYLVLDRLSEEFLRVKLLAELPAKGGRPQ